MRKTDGSAQAYVLGRASSATKKTVNFSYKPDNIGEAGNLKSLYSHF